MPQSWATRDMLGPQHNLLCPQAMGPAQDNQQDVQPHSPPLIKLWNSLPQESVVATSVLYVHSKAAGQVHGGKIN